MISLYLIFKLDRRTIIPDNTAPTTFKQTKKYNSWELKSELGPTRMMFVYKIQVNPIHTILKYGIYYDFMDR